MSMTGDARRLLSGHPEGLTNYELSRHGVRGWALDYLSNKGEIESVAIAGQPGWKLRPRPTEKKP